MNRFTGGRRLNICVSIAVALTVWWALTKLYSPLVVPTIPSVFVKLKEIVVDGELRRALWLTAGRFLVGLAAGVAIGTAVGATLGLSTRLREVFRPLVGLMQSVPPISWLVLALIWFGFNGKASVFIVIAAALPIMTMNVVEGVANIDPKLLQMARIYRFPLRKRLAHVILPSILPYFRAGLHVATGIGAKTVVMGEVLTTPSGIGGEITNARLNIEPESVVAWTIALMAMYFIFDKMAARLFRGRVRGNGNADNPQPDETLWQPCGAGASQPQG